MSPRKKQFDPDEVLEKAMLLFWRQGYEATSVQDLVDHMGINRFSLYDTFGDKHRLFLRAVHRYSELVLARRIAAIEAEPDGLKAIRVLANYGSTGQGAKGCLATHSIVERALDDPDLARETEALFGRLEKAFVGALERASAAGDIEAGRDLEALARLLVTLNHGFGVLTKTRPDPQVYRQVLESTLSAIGGR